MPACVEDCPVEVVESIVVLLDLTDICNLRQSCRSLAAKCAHGHFKSFFLSKRVDLTKKQLRAFAEVTQPGRLGCLIQELTLVGISKSRIRREFQRPKLSRRREIDLLGRAFSRLATNSKTGRLPSLLIEVEVATSKTDTKQRCFPGDGISRGDRQSRWSSHYVWRCTADTFDTVWRALAASSLPIERLNVFRSQQMQLCSLGCNHLAEVDWENPGLATSFATIQSLSISISNRDLFEQHITPEDVYDLHNTADADEDDEEDEREEEEEEEEEEQGKSRDNETSTKDTTLDSTSPEERDEDELRAEAQDENNFVGLKNLFRACSDLKDFDLNYFRLGNSPIQPGEMRHERLFQRCLELDRLPELQSCSLSGLRVTGEDLLAFVQRTSVRELTMEYVSLRPGSYRHVFDHLTSEAANTRSLFIEQCSEQDGGLLYFQGSTPHPFRIRHENQEGCPMLKLTGAELKQHIDYYFPTIRRWKSGPNIQERLFYTAREFGRG